MICRSELFLRFLEIAVADVFANRITENVFPRSLDAYIFAALPSTIPNSTSKSVWCSGNAISIVPPWARRDEGALNKSTVCRAGCVASLI